MLDIRFLNYPSVEKNNLVSVDVLMKFRRLIIHYQQNIFVPKKIIYHEQPFKKKYFHSKNFKIQYIIFFIQNQNIFGISDKQIFQLNFKNHSDVCTDSKISQKIQ